MPQKKGGKKHKKKTGDDVTNTPVMLREDDQEYAIITKLLGDRRVTAECFDGKIRCCLIRGKMRKRVWIKEGDVVLIALREFSDDKGDVIHKYSQDHVKQLEKLGEISSDIMKKSSVNTEDDIEDVFDFGDI